MPAPDFLEAYLSRRRQLETDRIAKEQFDREMQYRDATLQQQKQFHMETLAAQQAEQQATREQRAKEFAENVRLTQEARQQQREFDLAGMAAKGEIREPGNIEIPMAPGSTNPVLQGMPPAQLKEPGINFAGKNFVFTSPEERAEKVADVEEGVLERRRQRRITDLEDLYKSGQIPEQIYQTGRISLLMGQQPAQPDAEASYIWHNEAAAKALENGDNLTYNKHVRLAAQAKDWMEAKRQAIYPAGLAAQDDALRISGVHLRSAAQELGLDFKQQHDEATQRRWITLARQKALAAGDVASVRAADTVLGMPQNVKEREGMFQALKDMMADVEEFKQWQASQRKGQDSNEIPPVTTPRPQPTTQAPSVPPPTSPEQAMEQAIRLAGGPPWDPRADWSKFSPEAVKKVQAYLIKKGLQQQVQQQLQPAKQPIQYR